MQEWGGWAYDALRREITAPKRFVLKEGESRLFHQLLLAEGEPVGVVTLASYALVSGERSCNPKGLCALHVSRLRVKLGRFAIITVSGLGFKLTPAGKIDEAEALHGQERESRLSAEATAKARASSRQAQARELEKLTPSQVKKDRLVTLFKDQFEATGPHARAVARAVMQMFGEE